MRIKDKYDQRRRMNRLPAVCLHDNAIVDSDPADREPDRLYCPSCKRILSPFEAEIFLRRQMTRRYGNIEPGNLPM